MSVSFAMAEGRNLHYKIYSMNQLQALAKAFAGSDRAGGEVSRAVAEGYCRNPRPSQTDPKVVFVVNARVDLSSDGKPLYTVLFSLNAKFFELQTRPVANDGYAIVAFTQLNFVQFTTASRFYDRQMVQEFGREDANNKEAFDPSPSPVNDASSMPSGAITPIGKMDEYMNTVVRPAPQQSHYAHTPAHVGGHL